MEVANCKPWRKLLFPPLFGPTRTVILSRSIVAFSIDLNRFNEIDDSTVVPFQSERMAHEHIEYYHELTLTSTHQVDSRLR